jgi:hypothetical protein
VGVDNPDGADATCEFFPSTAGDDRGPVYLCQRMEAVVIKPGRCALDYLIASGSPAISIVEKDGACEIRLGTKIDPGAVSVFWLHEQNAVTVSRKARALAGERPDATTALDALQKATAQCRATLTPHDVAIQRAAHYVKRLDAMMEWRRKNGKIAIFNKRYKVARDAATAKGVRYMRYDMARAKLKMRLVPVLTSGGKDISNILGMFDETFGRARPRKTRSSRTSIAPLLDMRECRAVSVAMSL